MRLAARIAKLEDKAGPDRCPSCGDIDPATREYTYPDFGFAEHLNICGEVQNFWHVMFDYVQAPKKFERLEKFISIKT